ncbi:hypothetical protein ACFEB3_005245 [Escherichia coli]
MMVVGVTQWDQPPAKQVLLFGKSVRKPTGVLSGEWFLCVVLLCGKALKKRAFLVGDRARDPCIYTIGNNCGLCYFGLAQWWRGFER